MAVNLNTANAINLRSDYAVSDAAMAQRNADAAAAGSRDGGSRFEEMLAQADKEVQKFSDVKEAYDSGKFDVPTVEELEKAGVIYIDKETGRIYPENPKDLMTKILKGEIDLEGVPAELITPEFLKELAEFDESTSETDIGAELFKPNDDDLKDDFAKQIPDSSIMEELAQLLKAAAGEVTADMEGPVVEETAEIVVEKAAEVVQSSAVLPEVKTEIKSDEKPQTSENVRTDVFKLSDETAEIPVRANENAGEQQKSGEETSFSEQEVPEELKNLGAEKLETLQRAISDGEVSEVETKTVPEDEVKIETKTEEIPEVKETHTESRVKSASEELEMLRNAKTKPVSEQQNVPVNAENTLKTESPIVFRRGSEEISVRPSEIVEQAVKAVETAISENKEQTEYSLVLNPEELGRITVKMTKAADGAVSVTIAADNVRTQRILEQNSELMQSNLKSNGIQLESWQTVRESQQETYAQDYNGSSKNPYFSQENTENNDDEQDGESFADIIAAM